MADEVEVKLSLCANNTYGLYETMHSLNEIINALWKLSDTEYYLSYVFNGGADSDETIQNILKKDEIMELASKFEHIRAIVISEMFEQYSGNFRNLEYAILQSAWEQNFQRDSNERIEEYEKGKPKVSYYEFMKLASEIKKYFHLRYGEEIQE